MSAKKPYASLMIFALVSVVSSCGGDSGTTPTATTCAETEPVSGARLKKLPEGLPLDEWGELTEVSTRAGYVGAEAVTDTPIAELYPDLSRLITKNGFLIVNRENEGFEAEIFFQRGKAPGSILLREGPCEKQVTIKLLYKVAKDGK